VNFFAAHHFFLFPDQDHCQAVQWTEFTAVFPHHPKVGYGFGGTRNRHFFVQINISSKFQLHNHIVELTRFVNILRSAVHCFVLRNLVSNTDWTQYNEDVTVLFIFNGFGAPNYKGWFLIIRIPYHVYLWQYLYHFYRYRTKLWHSMLDWNVQDIIKRKRQLLESENGSSKAKKKARSGSKSSAAGDGSSSTSKGKGKAKAR
jgi:hypothetical protein